MAREVERLIDAKVRKLRDQGYHHDGAGLYLQVSPSGSKSWIYRYTLNGKTREMGLGAYPTFGLAEARERARAQRKLVADGKDPIEARDALRAQETLQRASTLTFDQCVARFMASEEKHWRNAKHRDQWKNTLDTYAGPVIGKLPVQAVDTTHLMRIIGPLWGEKTETASRVRGRIEKVLNWATLLGYRTGDNPARWRGHLDTHFKKRSKVAPTTHLEALPYTEIHSFIAKLRGQAGVTPAALEFAILTAARTGEVRGATFEEFDLENAVWTIPAERMKAGQLHRVPLSPRAVELVKAQPKGAHVFQGRQKNSQMSNNALLKLLERMKFSSITVHGFRSTFRDWAAECTNYPRNIAEKALAHTLKDKTEAAYQRGDLLEKRRHLMEDWANYCDKPAGAKVLPMARKVS